MPALLPLVLLLLASLIAWPLIRREPAARLVFLTVTASILYWYWIPAINVLEGGYLGEEEVLPNPDVARDAIWVVFLYHLALVASMSFVALSGPIRSGAPTPTGIPYRFLALANLVAALGLMFWLFSEYGLAFLIPVLTGSVSARDIMEFDNFSASAWESIRALLEVSVIFVTLALIAHAALIRRLSGLVGGLALVAIVILFLSTGTRALLLMALAAILLAAASGQRLPAPPRRGARALTGLLLAGLLLVPIGIAISARFASGTGQTNQVLALFLVNNDMFRELVYIETFMASFQTLDPMPFIKTPFTYVTPRFLGFTREIPEHVLAFNMARNGIDLILGAGNVFPGLLGDFRMAFGSSGPIWFALFLGVYAAMLRWLGTLCGPGILLTSVQIAAATFLFFSFRNIHPGLALVVIGAALALLLLRRLGRATTATPDAYRA